MQTTISNQTATLYHPLQGFYDKELERPHEIYLRQPYKREVTEYSWQEVGQQSRKMAGYLKKYPPGSKIAILSQNCAYWFIADLAIMMAGHISVPIYTSISGENIKYITHNAEVTALFLGESEYIQTLSEALPDTIEVITFPTIDHERLTITTTKWKQCTEASSALNGHPLPPRENLATIIYTSGSTGTPKGVMYNWLGIQKVMDAYAQVYEKYRPTRAFSYLPLAHLAERVLVLWRSMTLGFTVTFNESINTFVDDLKSARPSFFFAVPRIWSQFQSGILAQIGGQDKLNELLSDKDRSPPMISDIKKSLGLENTTLLITGAAPTPKSLHEWYERLNMPLCEGYGQSECILGAVNLPHLRKIGTLGKPVYGSEIKLGQDNEILIRSEGKMLGYFKDPSRTKQTLINDWIHTGDCGTIDEDGFLILTGRIKEIFKTAKGKYIAPVPIENLVAENPYIEQLCLIGSGFPQPILVATLIRQARKEKKIAVQESIKEFIKKINLRLDKHEKISHIYISKNEWTVNNKLLTHTMKIRRSAIEKLYTEKVTHLPKQTDYDKKMEIPALHFEK